MFDYLKFWITSSNHHGVHSPFVFAYLTECLYTKPAWSTQKTENVLLKSINYFNYHRLLIKNDPLITKIKHHFPDGMFKINGHPTFDFIYFEKPSQAELQAHIVHNQSMVLVDAIHHTRHEWNAWQKLIEQRLITVSIDFYHCGLLFFRKEQNKEHFRLRL